MNPRLCLFAILSTSALFGFGCGQQQQHIKEMSKPAWVEETAKWPELEELFHSTDGASMEKLQKAMSPRMGGGDVDTKQMAKNFEKPEFQARLNKFAETPVPDKYKTPEREAAKTELVEGFKKLVELAKKGDAKGLVQQHRANFATYQKIIKIPGQKPPEGAEAQKYAPPGG